MLLVVGAALGLVALEWFLVLAWTTVAFSVGLRVRNEVVEARHLRPISKYPLLTANAVLQVKRPGLWLFRVRTDSHLSRPYLLGPAKGQVRQLPNKRLIIEGHMPATGPLLFVVLVAIALVAILDTSPGRSASGIVLATLAWVALFGMWWRELRADLGAAASQVRDQILWID